ncbi:DUF1173 family protein [Nonomuraea soli]|uniref:Uncharacterized protein n=1 Tax=Nonomuraea soli TaxID=1032476 RepID=A0A7W0CUV8_9ACTN|nr:DUF1173 family protein [Nonomuraea soli]MBA2897756.1 hypothetical protein [Nonomuraea soli]
MIPSNAARSPASEVKDRQPTPYGQRLLLRHLREPLYLSTELLQRATRSYRSALSTSRLPTSRTIVLGVVERTTAGNLIIADLAAMLTNRAYIPADSSYEVRMADQLIASGRAFVKPLRYDNNFEVFPDFVLTDTDPWQYVEVWGMPGREAYERRKRDKQAHYRQAGIDLLGWDVNQPLPEMRRPHP